MICHIKWSTSKKIKALWKQIDFLQLSRIKNITQYVHMHTQPPFNGGVALYLPMFSLPASQHSLLFYHSRPSPDFWCHVTALLWKQWLCVSLREQRVISIWGLQSRLGSLLVNDCGNQHIKCYRQNSVHILHVLFPANGSFSPCYCSSLGTQARTEVKLSWVEKDHQSKAGSRV